MHVNIVVGVVLAFVAYTVGAAAAEPTAAQQASGVSPPTESTLELADAPGREKTAQCGACHSLDYIVMNSRFLDLAGWTAVVNKMVNAFGAPISKDDADAIARYLAEHYGKPAPPPAGD
jgi:mono/diheme cytochrome c family protein